MHNNNNDDNNNINNDNYNNNTYYYYNNYMNIQDKTLQLNIRFINVCPVIK